jgi:hypothetical protein
MYFLLDAGNNQYKACLMARLIVYCQSVREIHISLDYWSVEAWRENTPIRRANRLLQ